MGAEMFKTKRFTELSRLEDRSVTGTFAPEFGNHDKRSVEKGVAFGDFAPSAVEKRIGIAVFNPDFRHPVRVAGKEKFPAESGLLKGFLSAGETVELFPGLAVLAVTFFAVPEMVDVGLKIGTRRERGVTAVLKQRSDLNGKRSGVPPDACGENGAHTGMQRVTGKFPAQCRGTAFIIHGAQKFEQFPRLVTGGGGGRIGE